MHRQIVTTMFEGRYHHGVAALINSLVAAGFAGLVHVGHRGDLPPWAPQLAAAGGRYRVNDEIEITFEELGVAMHFGYYKPFLLGSVLDRHPEAEAVYYFDPDIVVAASWSFFRSWVEAGVALCLDGDFAYLHRNHPWRREWQALAAPISSRAAAIDYYVNSGFIGLKRSEAVLLDRWKALTEAFRGAGGNVEQFEKDGFRAFKSDQDLLNAALTVSDDVPVSVVGREGMGFAFPAFLMLHAVHRIKPWAKQFLLLSAQGVPPTAADKEYWRHARGPIRCYSDLHLLWRKFSLAAASLIGRFYARQ